MKSAIWFTLLLLPGLAFSQSLTDVAKKEKERREQNKQQGKEARVISEDDLAAPAVGGSGVVQVEGGSTGASRATAARLASDSDDDEGEEYDEEGEYSEDAPDRIPPELPLEQKLEMFQQMRRAYDQQVRELDNAIAENNERLRQLEARIGATQALGGGGLPVAPQTGTGAANAPMTGQDTQQLVAEQQQLQRMNQQMENRKQQLKIDLQAKGRSAGIPPGYLRF